MVTVFYPQLTFVDAHRTLLGRRRRRRGSTAVAALARMAAAAHAVTVRVRVPAMPIVVGQIAAKVASAALVL